MSETTEKEQVIIRVHPSIYDRYWTLRILDNANFMSFELMGRENLIDLRNKLIAEFGFPHDVVPESQLSAAQARIAELEKRPVWDVTDKCDNEYKGQDIAIVIKTNAIRPYFVLLKNGDYYLCYEDEILPAPQPAVEKVIDVGEGYRLADERDEHTIIEVRNHQWLEWQNRRLNRYLSNGHKSRYSCEHPVYPRDSEKWLFARVKLGPLPEKSEVEKAKNDICPKCDGELDTGWECNQCGFDAQHLANSKSVTDSKDLILEVLEIAHDVLHKCRGFISDQDIGHKEIGDAMQQIRQTKVRIEAK